jgi:hypothetical protein
MKWDSEKKKRGWRSQGEGKGGKWREGLRGKRRGIIKE